MNSTNYNIIDKGFCIETSSKKTNILHSNNPNHNYNESYSDEEIYDEEIYDNGFNTFTEESNSKQSNSIDKNVTSINIIETIKQFATFSSVLRMSGALIVIASMLTFLFKGWSDGNDISRYYMLLAQTFALSLGGFGLSYILKENKGARVFFGLGLLSITINMTILGALIFSTTQWGSNLASYESFATWTANNFNSLLIVIAASLATLIPIAIFSFMIFARKSAKILSLLFMLTNILLLIPVRESIYVGIIAVIGTILPIIFIRRNLKESSSLRTAEGYFALITLFLPLLIIVGRSLWLYQMDTLLQLTLSIMGFAILHVSILSVTDKKSSIRPILEWLSVLVSISIAIATAQLIKPLLPINIGLSVLGIVFSIFTFYIAKTSIEYKQHFVMIAGLALAICNIAQIASTETLIGTLLSISSGVALILVSLKLKERLLLVLGSLTVIAGLGQHIIDIIKFVNFSNWITLAVIGVSTIIIASILERHGAVIKLKFAKLTKMKFDD